MSSLLSIQVTSINSWLAAITPVPADNWLQDVAVVLLVILAIVVAALALRLLSSLRSLRSVDSNDEDRKIKKEKNFKILSFINSIMFPLFFIALVVGIIWEWQIHIDFIRPRAASEQGLEIDKLFSLTSYITAVVFLITTGLLCFFAYRYAHKEGRKAFFYPHNNTLEFIWTIVPAIVLASVVLYGFKTWQKATDDDGEYYVKMEAFAKQFDWTFRYAGPDGVLGRVSFLLMDETNPLGIDYSDPASHDDFLTTEMHLPKGKPVQINVRSRDVLHSLYLPHFRVQIYAQPGLANHVQFVPIYTTAEMKVIAEDQDFDYELACNQLCGAAHWNMRRVVKVDELDDYTAWLSNEQMTPEFKKMEELKKNSSATTAVLN